MGRWFQRVVGPKGRWSGSMFRCITMDVQLNGQINPDVQIFTVKLVTLFYGPTYSHMVLHGQWVNFTVLLTLELTQDLYFVGE